MNDRFTAYLAIAAASVVIAVLIMGPRRLLRTSTIVRWYLLVFVLTYILRPLGSHWWGDAFLYQWLDLDGFDPYWTEIAAAVTTAIVSFAIGYRLARAPVAMTNPLNAKASQNLVKMKAMCAWMFIAFGYASIPFATRVGGAVVNDPYTGLGTYQGTSFYLTNANILSSSGSVLLYAATGRIWLAAAAAAPWLAMRVSFGWQRSDMLGFLFALLGVQALRAKAGARSIGRGQRAILVVAIGFVGIVIFPLLSLGRGHFANGIGIADMAAAADPGTALPIWFNSAADIQGFETSIYHLQQREGHLYGTDLLYFFLVEPIPRMIWPDKPLPTTAASRWFGYDVSAHDQGWSPGSIGEAVREFGWLGIPLLFCFDGWLLRKVELWIAQAPADIDRQVIAASFYWLVPVMGRNSLITLLAVGWMFQFAPIVVALLYLNRQARISDGSRRLWGSSEARQASAAA